jgi:predicted lipid-binding transport protein (Tim44 family)
MTKRRFGQLLGILSSCIAIVVWFYMATQQTPQQPPQAPLAPGASPVARADFPWTFYLGFAASLLGLVAGVVGKGAGMVACLVGMLPIGAFAWLYPFPFSILTLTMLAYAIGTVLIFVGGQRDQAKFGGKAWE